MLDVKNLHAVYYGQRNAPVPAVRGIDLSIAAGSALALVGESGSGKSTAALAIMRLVRHPIGDVTQGQVLLDGADLLAMRQQQMRRVLRHDIGYVPQDPTTALDPLYTVRSQILESSEPGTRAERVSAAVALLERLGVGDAQHRLTSYPHEFSGGMRQRVAIAIALSKNPKLLIADEPTTALDVTTQLGILRLLDELRRERGLAMLFVTHDLAVARLVCQNVAVMYGGIVVESGPIDTVLSTPLHPYTQALLDSAADRAPARTRLRAIPGSPPPLTALPPGCPFAPRCPVATPECEAVVPVVERHGSVDVRCIRPGAAAGAMLSQSRAEAVVR